MFKVYLVILFLVDGNWEIKRGYYPMEKETMESCLGSALLAQDYFKRQNFDPNLVFCLPTEEGFESQDLEDFIVKQLMSEPA